MYRFESLLMKISVDFFFLVYVMSKGDCENYTELQNLKDSHVIVNTNMPICIVMEDR